MYSFTLYFQKMKKLSIVFILITILFTSCTKKINFKLKTINSSGSPMPNIGYHVSDAEHSEYVVAGGTTDSSGVSLIELEIHPGHWVYIKASAPNVTFSPEKWSGEARDIPKALIFKAQ
jgi:hypothetical protein